MKEKGLRTEKRVVYKEGAHGYAIKDTRNNVFFAETFRTSPRETKDSFLRLRGRDSLPMDFEVVPVKFIDME